MNSRKNNVCALCGLHTVTHIHHVLGRVGPQKNEPYNLIELCPNCHRVWHTMLPDIMADKIYAYMKSRYDDQFPMWVNGRPYYTKWLVRAEDRCQHKEK